MFLDPCSKYLPCRDNDAEKRVENKEIPDKGCELLRSALHLLAISALPAPPSDVLPPCHKLLSFLKSFGSRQPRNELSLLRLFVPTLVHYYKLKKKKNHTGPEHARLERNKM